MTQPNLDAVVTSALSLHAHQTGSELAQARLQAMKRALSGKRLLVVASGNALPTGRIVFRDDDASFATEGEYGSVLGRVDFGGAVVISASGGKHAPGIVRRLLAAGLDTFLMTCDVNSPAASLLDEDRVIVTASQSEPLTYNTSTYLGMVLRSTGEDPGAILRHLDDEIAPLLADDKLDWLGRFGAHYILLPTRYETIVPMVVTKFDELFGGRLNGRVYTLETTKHAKTVVPWDRELFTSVGAPVDTFGEHRITLPLSVDAGFGEIIAVTYYLVGRIQCAHPRWFWDNVDAYTRFQRELFED